MNKKEPLFYFYCPKCGADVQENLIDKEKSNSNWTVSKENCPFCGSKLSIKIKNK